MSDADSAPKLLVSQLSHEAFAPFGHMIACPGHGSSRTVNEGSAERWDDQVQLTSTRPGARLNVATFQSQPRPLPFAIRTLERHPCSTQMFLPLTAGRYVVVVAEGHDAVPGKLHAFMARGGVGVAYAPNTWHHTLLVLDSPAAFSCMVWEDGSADDCEVVELDPAAQHWLHVE